MSSKKVWVGAALACPAASASVKDQATVRVAYPIQKKTTGFYYLIEFEGEGDLVEKLETQYRRDERVIRFLTFRMDKYAVEYAEKRRNKYKSKQE